MEYEKGLPVYQPKFEAWLAVLGLPLDCPIADLPKNWKSEYMVWSMANPDWNSAEKSLSRALDRDACFLAVEFP